MSDDEEDTDTPAIIECVKGLPQGTTIEWTQHHVDHLGILTGYVDVYAPLISDEVGTNWTWTVEVPYEIVQNDKVWKNDDPFGWTIVVPGKWRVYSSWVPADYDSDEDHVVVALDDNGVETAFSSEQQAVLQAVPDSRNVHSNDGWTPDEVSAIVKRWIVERTGRVDLIVQYKPDLHDPLLDELDERMKLSKDEFIQVGDGVMAHPDVMDKLLAMPAEHAAEVTRHMQNIRDAAVEAKEQ